jgi:HSF-type DNA-binding
MLHHFGRLVRRSFPRHTIFHSVVRSTVLPGPTSHRKAFEQRFLSREHDTVEPLFSQREERTMKSGTRQSPRKSLRRSIPSLSVVAPSNSSRSDQYDDRTTGDNTSHAVVTPIAKGGVACPFPWRLHEMLEYVHTNEMEHIASWDDKGKAFTVHDSKAFVSRILPRYVVGSRAAPRSPVAVSCHFMPLSFLPSGYINWQFF